MPFQNLRPSKVTPFALTFASHLHRPRKRERRPSNAWTQQAQTQHLLSRRLLRWVQRPRSVLRTRDPDMEPQRPARRAPGPGRLDPQEGPHPQARVVEAAQVQEHLQGLHARAARRAVGERRQRGRHEEPAVLLRRGLSPLHLDQRHVRRLHAGGEAAVPEPRGPEGLLRDQDP